MSCYLSLALNLDNHFNARLMAADYYEGDTSPNTTDACNGGVDVSISVILTP